MNLKTVLTLALMCAASNAAVAQTYSGTLSCSQSLSDEKRPSFEQPAELVVKNGNAQMKRSSDRYDEVSEGQVVGQQLSLQGQGKRATGGESWTTKFQGTLDGRTFKATGGIYTTKGEKYRDCQVLLVNTVKAVEQVTQALIVQKSIEPVKATPASITPKPIEQVVQAPTQTTVVQKPLIDSQIIASFDCQKAASKTEKLICSNPQTAKLDIALSNAYRKTLAASDNTNNLKSEQMAWLSSVRNKCESSECLDREYAARIKALEQRVETSIAKTQISAPAQVEIPVLSESKQNGQTQSTREEQTVASSVEKKVTQQISQASTQPEKSSRELAREKGQKEREVESAKYAAQNKIEQAKRDSDDKLLFGGGGILAVIAAWFWNKFIRNRCPKCKSTAFDTTNIAETDRWRGTKQVTERNSKGNNTRHVSTTYVKKMYTYRCRACQNEWSIQKKEEM